MTLAQQLRQVLSSEKKWARGSKFINKAGHPCDVEQAVGFCLIGALIKVTGERFVTSRREYTITKQAVSEVSKEHDALSCFNDDPRTTFSDIQKVIDKVEELEASLLPPA